MTTSKPDLRVVKTHKTIRQALIDLLQHTEFENITVQDILEQALVNRSTFYKYYSGKSDLAGKMIADFKQEYTRLLQMRFEQQNFSNFMKEMPKVMFSFRPTLLALWKIDTRRHHLYQDMFEMIRKRYLQLATERGVNGDVEYQAHMVATLALTSAKYRLERNELAELTQSLNELQTALQTMSK